MRSILIYLVIVIILGLFAPGCTIHFKGENIELDADRQRVYHLDTVTFSEFAKTDHKTECDSFAMDNVQIFRSKPQDITHRKRKFIAAGKTPSRSAQ